MHAAESDDYERDDRVIEQLLEDHCETAGFVLLSISSQPGARTK